MPTYSAFWQKNYRDLRNCCLTAKLEDHPRGDGKKDPPEDLRYKLVKDLIDTGWMVSKGLKWIGQDKDGWLAWTDADGMLYRVSDLKRNDDGKRYEKEVGKIRLQGDGESVPSYSSVTAFYQHELNLQKDCALCPHGGYEGEGDTETTVDAGSGDEDSEPKKGVNVPGWQEYAAGRVTTPHGADTSETTNIAQITDYGALYGSPAGRGYGEVYPDGGKQGDQGNRQPQPRQVESSNNRNVPDIFRSYVPQAIVDTSTVADPRMAAPQFFSPINRKDDYEKNDCYPSDSSHVDDAPAELRPYLNNLKNSLRYLEIRKNWNVQVKDLIYIKIKYYTVGGDKQEAVVVLQDGAKGGKVLKLGVSLQQVGSTSHNKYHAWATELSHQLVDCDKINRLEPGGPRELRVSVPSLEPTKQITATIPISINQPELIQAGQVVFPPASAVPSDAARRELIKRLQKVAKGLEDNSDATLKITGNVSETDSKSGKLNINDHLTFVDENGNLVNQNVTELMLARARYVKNLLLEIAKNSGRRIKNKIELSKAKSLRSRNADWR